MQSKLQYSDGLKAGIFSLSVHAVLVMLLLVSFNWKTAQPPSVAEVTLWDSVPNQSPPTPEPPPVMKVPEIVPPPIVEVESVEEEKVQEAVENDIVIKAKEQALEKKKLEEQKKLKEAEKKAQQLEQKKLLAALQKEMNQEQPVKKETKTPNNALKKLQQEALADEQSASEQQASSAIAAVNASIIGEYQNKIRNKIRGNVNKSLCGNGNPELKFDIGLLPTGQLSSTPKLIKSSGSAACDEAVERAIMASEPLPLPSETGLFAQFRNLKLTFRPND